MFGWLSKKDKTTKQTESTKSVAPLSREELKAQALANARKARETIGEENIQKLAQMLQEHEQHQKEQTVQPEIPQVENIQDPGQYKPPPGSPAEAAKRILEEMDQADVARNLRQMIDDERK